MDLITYKTRYDSLGNIVLVRVFVANHLTGIIEKHKDGWRYTAKSGFSGDQFGSIAAVKQSLEQE